MNREEAQRICNMVAVDIQEKVGGNSLLQTSIKLVNSDIQLLEGEGVEVIEKVVVDYSVGNKDESGYQKMMDSDFKMVAVSMANLLLKSDTRVIRLFESVLPTRANCVQSTEGPILLMIYGDDVFSDDSLVMFKLKHIMSPGK